MAPWPSAQWRKLQPTPRPLADTLLKYKVEGLSRTTPPQAAIEKSVYFFREAKNLDIVPEPLQYPPIVEALDAARTATFTAIAQSWGRCSWTS